MIVPQETGRSSNCDYFAVEAWSGRADGQQLGGHFPPSLSESHCVFVYAHKVEDKSSNQVSVPE